MITVVSGLPRAGTSLMMQMLAAGGLPVLGDGVRPPDASNPRGYFEYEPVKHLARDAAWLEAAEGRVVKVVVPLVAFLPPGRAYRVVFMERALDEVLASQARMLGRLGRPAGNPALLAPAFTVQLERARAFLRTAPDTAVLPVAYADLLRDPAAQAARLQAFLGPSLDAAAMARAVDPALYRERGAAG
jgi:hypothetical protein